MSSADVPFRNTAHLTGRLDPPSYSTLSPLNRANTQGVDIATEINSFTTDVRYLKRLWEEVLRDLNRLPDDAKPDLQSPFDVSVLRHIILSKAELDLAFLAHTKSYLGFIKLAQSTATELRVSIVISRHTNIHITKLLVSEYTPC
jgi:hypothetical protein